MNPSGFALPRKSFSVGLACLLALSFLSAALFAQTNTGSIRGTVADATGALVPNATVVLTNTGTGVRAEQVSNQAGEYLFEFLAPGQYSVQSQVSGFKT